MKEFFLLIFFFLSLPRHGTCSDANWTAIQDKLSTDLATNTRVAIWYEATFNCPSPGFCAIAYYREEDQWIDDQLAFVRLSCTNTTTLKHYVLVFVEGRDPPQAYRQHKVGTNYEPKVSVYHSCRNNMYNYITRSSTYLPTIPVRSNSGPRSLRFAYELDLNNADVVADELPGELDQYHRWGYTFDYNTMFWKERRDITKCQDVFVERRMRWEAVQFRSGVHLCYGDVNGLYEICKIFPHHSDEYHNTTSSLSK